MKKEVLAEIVKQTLYSILPELNEFSINEEDNLESLGANSMDRLELITVLSEQLEITHPMIYFSSAKTIGDLIKLLEKATIDTCST